MAQAMRSRLASALLRARLAPSTSARSASSKRSFSASAGHDDAYETEKWKKITFAGIIACTALAIYDLSGGHEHFEEPPLTMGMLLFWIRDNLLKERPEMFMKGNSV